MAETPFFHELNQVSEADLNRIPAGRGGAQFSKWLIDQGRNPGLTLLTSPKGNTKIKKNMTSPNPMARLSYQATMNLSPARSSGVTDTCGSCSTAGCRNNCINDTYQMSGPDQQAAQINRTKFGVLHPDLFLAMLRDELSDHSEQGYARELHPVARLNTVSDTAFHRLKVAPIIIGNYAKTPQGLHLPKEIRHLPGMTFNEYSKEGMRDVRGVPEPNPVYANHHIAYSASELTTAGRVDELLKQNKNVYFPVDRSKGPASVHPNTTFKDLKTGAEVTAPSFDADRDDARWADPEKASFGIFAEKKRGNYSKGLIINPHTNEHGFIRENIPAQNVSLSRKLNSDQFGE